MRITLNAELIENARGEVTIEVPLKTEYARFDGPVRMEDERGIHRELSRTEERDLEDALESFRNQCTARALAKLILVR